MAATRKTKKKVDPNAIPFDQMTPSQQVAHTIKTTFSDLAPSVQLIMEADITEDQRFQAITLFRDSLSSPGDPNRNPRHALAYTIGA